MKFFIDTANTYEIKEVEKTGLLDGVTTNPSLMSREIERTGKSSDAILKEICAAVKGPVSGEVIASDTEGMIKEARQLAAIAPNICVKIPMTEEGIKAVKVLSSENIMTNVTLVFTPVQAVMAAKAGASFVSPFIGRLDDISSDGMRIIEDITLIFGNYGYETEVIVASVRHPMHVLESMRYGADVCTIPYKVIKQLIKHPLTDAGIKKFMEDYEKTAK